jgi:hypothetical protein
VLEPDICVTIEAGSEEETGKLLLTFSLSPFSSRSHSLIALLDSAGLSYPQLHARRSASFDRNKRFIPYCELTWLLLFARSYGVYSSEERSVLFRSGHVSQTAEGLRSGPGVSKLTVFGGILQGKR